MKGGEYCKSLGGKVESCSRIKDGNGRFAQGKDEVGKIWEEYFEDLYNIDIQKEVAVHICSFEKIQRGNYFEGKPIGRDESGQFKEWKGLR